MFRITFTWGHYGIKEYVLCDDVFETMAHILGFLPGAQILEVL